MDPVAALEVVVKRKLLSPYRESNPNHSAYNPITICTVIC
jgi:hypothetical protein